MFLNVNLHKDFIIFSSYYHQKGISSENLEKSLHRSREDQTNTEGPWLSAPHATLYKILHHCVMDKNHCQCALLVATKNMLYIYNAIQIKVIIQSKSHMSTTPINATCFSWPNLIWNGLMESGNVLWSDEFIFKIVLGNHRHCVFLDN